MGERKNKVEVTSTSWNCEDALEPMSFLTVSDLNGLGHQKPGSLVMELNLALGSRIKKLKEDSGKEEQW